MTDLDEAFMEALQRGIDHERALEGDETGWPYTAAEWDNAGASVLATCILRAPFRKRRQVLLGMLADLICCDGFFQAGGDDDAL
jgi:hypothetical protein